MHLTTPELQVGDVVVCHGLICLIDRAIRLTNHAGGNTFATFARVLNRADVPQGRVPYVFTAVDMSDPSEDWPHRWTIQGNELATWVVYRAEPNPHSPREPRKVPASA